MENIFKDPKVLSRLRQEPFGPYLSVFAKSLREQGYTISTVRLQLQMIGAFNLWLQERRFAITQIASQHFHEYIRYREQRRLPKRSAAVSALRQLLDFLCSEGVIERDQPAPPTPAEKLTEEFVRYLKEERALAVSTATQYQKLVMRFLTDRFADTEVDLGGLRSADIVSFVQRQAAAMQVKQSKLMTTALRSFLQFARYQDYINIDLAAAVPTVASWSMADIPRALPRKQVEMAVSCCDRQTAIGRRDYAILLLLARLGLRAGEVASLTLEDIDWRQGRISVHGKTGHRPDLPLPADVGEAIAAYLQDGRPKTKDRALFLRGRAPARGFKGSATVSRIVAYALARAGIDTAQKGAHQFRHGLATELLRQGASLIEIGELLGHRSPRTTAIYAKVDLDSLRPLALPWPGGVQ